MKTLALLALVACSSKAEIDTAKIDVTKQFTKRLVGETYPRWAARNTGKTCPTIDDLIAMLDGEGNTDPWDRPYKLTCTDSAISIRSAGPDGAYDNADDIVTP